MYLTKTPAEEAYKKIFNQYPNPENGSWKLFKVGFECGKNETSQTDKTIRNKIRDKYPNVDIDELLNVFVTELVK
jgi:hypothetical protein